MFTNKIQFTVIRNDGFCIIFVAQAEAKRHLVITLYLYL